MIPETESLITEHTKYLLGIVPNSSGRHIHTGTVSKHQGKRDRVLRRHPRSFDVGGDRSVVEIRIGDPDGRLFDTIRHERVQRRQVRDGVGTNLNLIHQPLEVWLRARPKNLERVALGRNPAFTLAPNTPDGPIPPFGIREHDPSITAGYDVAGTAVRPEVRADRRRHGDRPVSSPPDPNPHGVAPGTDRFSLDETGVDGIEQIVVIQ